MRRRFTVALGALCLALVACGVAATPTPASRTVAPIGCFSPMEVAVPLTAPPVAQRRAEEVAREYFERQRGATLARYTDATGAQVVRPPIEARALVIRASLYGHDLDPLRGRVAWLFGFAIEQAAPWSTLRPRSTAYALIDAQTAVVLIDCATPPA